MSDELLEELATRAQNRPAPLATVVLWLTGGQVNRVGVDDAAFSERAAKYLRKGRSVLVEGRLQTRVWADARGNKHITAEVRADRILFLSRGNAGRDVAGDGPGRADGEAVQGGRGSSQGRAAATHAGPAS